MILMANAPNQDPQISIPNTKQLRKQINRESEYIIQSL